MRRREFIAGVGAAAAWSLAAPAQQPALPVVAVIQGGGVARLAGFRKGLNATGYAEGQNATVEYHWLQGDYKRLPALLADLVRRRVSVVATLDTPSALSTKNANTTIPVVFAVGEDPVALGLVANLAQPGGNATGINFFSLETNAKRLGLMHELLPTPGGMMRSSALAVLRLIRNSYFVACTTGRSAGFSPLRIRPM